MTKVSTVAKKSKTKSLKDGSSVSVKLTKSKSLTKSLKVVSKKIRPSNARNVLLALIALNALPRFYIAYKQEKLEELLKEYNARLAARQADTGKNPFA